MYVLLHDRSFQTRRLLECLGLRLSSTTELAVLAFCPILLVLVPSSWIAARRHSLTQESTLTTSCTAAFQSLPVRDAFPHHVNATNTVAKPALPGFATVHQSICAVGSISLSEMTSACSRSTGWSEFHHAHQTFEKPNGLVIWMCSH